MSGDDGRSASFGFFLFFFFWWSGEEWNFGLIIGEERERNDTCW